MTRWLVALLAAGALALATPPLVRPWAFAHGWFERSDETRRRRSFRRPTTGGLIATAAVAAGALFGGAGEPVARGVLAAAAVSVAAAFLLGADKRIDPKAVAATRIAAAVALAAAGPRASLTGDTSVDVVLVALAALLVIGGLARLEHADGALPLAVAIPATVLVQVAASSGQEAAAAVAAGAAGAAVGFVGHTITRSTLRFGRTGPTVLGAALTSSALAYDPGTGDTRGWVVPLALLAPAALAALLPDLTTRWRTRGLHVLPTVVVTAGAGAVAALLCDLGHLDAAPALALGTTPAALAGMIGASSRGVEVRRASRSVGIAALAATFGAVVLAAFAGWTLLEVRVTLEDGRDAAQDGLRAAADGDLDAANRAFTAADAAFADASASLDSPALVAGLLVPGVAQNLRATRELAEVGGELAQTATAVATRAGADDLSLRGGSIPLPGIAEVGARLTSAVTTLDSAAARLATHGGPLLVGELRRGIDSVIERIDEASGTVRDGAAAASLAPGLLGGDGARTYVVALLTPSELRGAGGLFGDFAELRVDQGRFEVVRSGGAGSLNAAVDDAQQAAALPAVYADEYDTFQPGRFWQNLSATPDLPTFGAAVTAAWPLTGDGARADGVIAIDPIGIAALLALTGPVRVPAWPDPISARNAAPVLLFEHYDALAPEEIDAFQTDLVDAVVDALGSADLGNPGALAAALAPAAAGGHLRLYSAQAEEQQLFASLELDGALPPDDGSDALVVTIQNGSEAKIDWFLDQQVAYDVTFDESTGSTTASATLTLTNRAPATGVSDYVIGGVGGPTEAGENRLFAGILTPLEIVAATDGDGASVGLTLGTEGTFNSARALVVIPPGGRTVIRFEVAGRLDADAYLLQLRAQVAARPTEVTFTLNGRSQVRSVDASAGFGAISPRGDDD